MIISSREQAHQVANDILDAFGKRRNVVINWTGKSTKGRATWYMRRITIGPRAWRGVDQCLIHEVAHLIAPRGVKHSYEFFITLAAVAKHFYGDVRLYDWHTEYRRIRLWAAKEGWCVKIDDKYFPHPYAVANNPFRFASAAGSSRGDK